MSDTAWILWSLYEKAWLKHGALFVLWLLSVFFTLLLSWKYKIRWQKNKKNKTTVHVLTLSGSLYRHFGTFNCSWEQLFWLFMQLAVCFIYKCTVSVLVRSLHMKEKRLHKPLAKLMLLNLYTLIEGTYSIICTYYTCPVYVWSKIVFGFSFVSDYGKWI